MTVSRRSMLKLLLLSGLLRGAPSMLEAQTRPTILIIGAGAAGLAAGRQLQDAGYPVVILEARDRIGGRVWTDRTLGVPLDMGASWIHGITDNPITEIVRANNIRVSQVTDYVNVVVYDATGRELSEQELAHLEAGFEAVTEYLEDTWDSFPDDASLQEGIDAAIRDLGLTEQDIQQLNFLVDSYIESEYAADASQLALKYYDSDEAFSGGDVIFPEGYDQVMTVLAQGLDIRLGQRVQAIAYRQDGVTVTTDQGAFEARAAIVTLPLGVLKQNSVRFAPPLPGPKQRAIQQLGMGVLNKVYLRFPSVFWDTEADFIARIPTRKGEWQEVMNLYLYTGEPLLLFFIGGAFGLQIEGWSDEQVIQGAMDALQSIYGDAIPAPTATRITRWGQDEWSYGAYSSIAPGATDEDRRVLGQPLANALFFAGEATTDFAATVSGAILSGYRAASEVMRLRA